VILQAVAFCGFMRYLHPALLQHCCSIVAALLPQTNKMPLSSAELQKLGLKYVGFGESRQTCSGDLVLEDSELIMELIRQR
jgi:hypothetical protein